MGIELKIRERPGLFLLPSEWELIALGLQRANLEFERDYKISGRQESLDFATKMEVYNQAICDMFELDPVFRV